MVKKKKFKQDIEIKGDLRFDNIDTHRAVMELKDVDGLLSVPFIRLDPGLFPADFELAKYEVTGEYSFVVTIRGR